MFSLKKTENTKEISHKTGYYGINQMTQNIILLDRTKLKYPNGFIFGVPGKGKSFWIENKKIDEEDKYV